jgi:hypothetical protein
MTTLLEKAFGEAAKLSPKDQDALAAQLLADLESEQRWAEAFARSQDKLAALADEALAEFQQGETKPLTEDL